LKGVKVPHKTVSAAMLCFNQKSLDGLMEFFDKKSVLLLDHGQDSIEGVKSLRKFFKKGFESNPYSQVVLDEFIETGTVLMAREINSKSGSKGDKKSALSVWVYQVCDQKIKVMHEFNVDYKTIK